MSCGLRDCSSVLLRPLSAFLTEIVAVVQGEIFVLDLEQANPEWRQPEVDTSGLNSRVRF
jgi:hypothetical protein